MKLGDYDAAKPLIVQNIDEEKEISLNSRILGEVVVHTPPFAKGGAGGDFAGQHGKIRPNPPL